MKLLIVLCLVAVAIAAPPYSDVQVLRYESDNIGTGGYRFAFEQSDGTRHESQGQLKNEGREDESLFVSGSYSWVAPNGVTYLVKYIADENGYQPEIEEGPGASPAVVASLLG